MLQMTRRELYRKCKYAVVFLLAAVTAMVARPMWDLTALALKKKEGSSWGRVAGDLHRVWNRVRRERAIESDIRDRKSVV